MFAFCASFVIVILCIVLYEIAYRKRNAAFATFPTIRKHLLIHNCLALAGLNMSALLRKLIEWQQEIGEVFLITAHPFDSGAVVVSDPVIAEAVSFHQPDRTRTFIYKSLSRWIGTEGFFLAPTERSKVLLKPIWKAFNLKNLDKSVSCINFHSNEWLNQMVGPDSGSILIPDIFEVTRRVVLDISFDTIMSFPLNSKNGEHSDYVKAIKKFSKLSMIAMFDPRSSSDFLHQFTSLYRAEQKNLKILHDVTCNIVKDRRKMFAEGTKTEAECIVDYYFLNSFDGRFMTDEEIRAEVDTMILGSHDTTQTSIGFLTFMMGKHPEIQEKVFEEVAAIIPDDPTKDLTEADVDKLVYIDCVVKESLRMFAPIPFVGRKLRSELTVGGFTFPKDVEVVISPFLIGRNPKYFNEPEKFDPDRFLGLENVPLAYAPFSIGAKKCIGGKLAMLSMKLSLAKIIRRFKISLPEGQDQLNLGCEIVLIASHKVPVIVERRTA